MDASRVRQARLLLGFMLMAIVGGGSATAAPRPAATRKTESRAPRFKAVAFDFLVLFSTDSVVVEAERVFPGRGTELVSLWRTRQFEYSWLRATEGRYVDFLDITTDALVFAARSLKLELTEGTRQRLVDAYLQLAPWADTADALHRLKAAGVRVITLSNFSPAMLRANVEHAGLTTLFDGLISTGDRRTYKPDPRAYQLGLDRLRLAKRDVLFVAFGSWDAAGAKAFGYPTFWVNRANQPGEELGFDADATAPTLEGLVTYVLGTAPDSTSRAPAPRQRSRRSSILALVPARAEFSSLHRPLPGMS